MRAAGWLGVPDDHPFGLQTLPFGVLGRGGAGAPPYVGVRIGDRMLDLTAAAAAKGADWAPLFAAGTLDRFLAAGRPVWDGVRRALTLWLSDPEAERLLAPLLVAVDGVDLLLPFTVADYVDFYASEHHARHLGALFRPGQPALTPNWKHLPIGYHGRAGTVVVSGTPVVRPSGQRRTPDGVVFGPSTRLDLEAEVGFVVGRGSRLGTSVGLAEVADHVFGVCLVNDWSARDVQAWEYVPLGPFLGKSFATSVSPWVVPLAALEAARVAPPARDPRPLPYLDDVDDAEPWGLDLTLEVALNDTVLSTPPFASTYWTCAQMLAHLTVGGASLRPGDLFASGTVSGPEASQRGSLIELSENGTAPVRLADGTTRSFLEDGDEVVITATAPGPGGTTVGLGEVRGRVEPARVR